jgi:hypothetical protein
MMRPRTLKSVKVPYQGRPARALDRFLGVGPPRRRESMFPLHHPQRRVALPGWSAAPLELGDPELVELLVDIVELPTQRRAIGSRSAGEFRKTKLVLRLGGRLARPTSVLRSGLCPNCALKAHWRLRVRSDTRDKLIVCLVFWWAIGDSKVQIC